MVPQDPQLFRSVLVLIAQVPLPPHVAKPAEHVDCAMRSSGASAFCLVVVILASGTQALSTATVPIGQSCAVRSAGADPTSTALANDVPAADP
jgi:hypothetical protein